MFISIYRKNKKRKYLIHATHISLYIVYLRKYSDFFQWYFALCIYCFNLITFEIFVFFKRYKVTNIFKYFVEQNFVKKFKYRFPAKYVSLNRVFCFKLFSIHAFRSVLKYSDFTADTPFTYRKLKLTIRKGIQWNYSEQSCAVFKLIYIKKNIYI